MDDIKKRDDIINTLQQEIEDEEFPPTSNIYNSWVRGEYELSSDDDSTPYPTKQCRFFDKHGFILIPNFASTDEVQSMKSTMEQIVNDEWHPSKHKSTEVFRTDDKQCDAQGKSDYFLDSADKVNFFGETSAIIEESGELKEEYKSNKLTALNKVGHGIHTRFGPFKEYTQSNKVSKLLRDLGWKAPVVPQSMYIFKQALIGGEVTSHQDSTFLYTTPKQTCIGLWLALDEATLENGCLWVRPGSHKESVRRQFVRNPDHFGKSLTGDGDDGDSSKPQMIFEKLSDEDDDITWEGGLPKDLYEAGFIPVPVKAGDLLAFNGELDHLSLPNTSSNARHTFQLHCTEGEEAGVAWSNENWLQYPSGTSFMKL